MAVKIRLARRGRKKLALYDVVVADARAPRDGRFIEKIGTYNPNTDPASININDDRALKWLLNGAQPTDTVKAMLSYRGVLLKKHLRIGVIKGAVSEEEAEKRFEEWKERKEAAISGKISQLSDAKEDARKKALEAEAAKNTARLEALKKKEAEALAAAKAAEAPEAPEAEATEAPEAEAAEAPEAESTEATQAPEAEAPKGETPQEGDAPESTEEKQG